MSNHAVIVNTTDIRKIRAGLNRRKDEVVQRLVQTLAYIGERCVKIAREDHQGNWNDITGNLRSSIGYAVLVEGQPAAGLNNQFERHHGKSGDGSQGMTAAQQMLQNLQGVYDKGVVLIVVAGMRYAAYVEDVRHRVVLSGAKLQADQLAHKLLNSLTTLQS